MYKVLTLNDPSAKDIDSSVKNKFKWNWLQEHELVGGCPVGYDCFTKISLPGQVLCKLCGDKINYASSGKKALRHHINSPKHLKVWKLKQSNMVIAVNPQEGVIAVESMDASEKQKVVPLCNRVANNQVKSAFVIT